VFVLCVFIQRKQRSPIPSRKSNKPFKEDKGRGFVVSGFIAETLLERSVFFLNQLIGGIHSYHPYHDLTNYQFCQVLIDAVSYKSATTE